MFYVFFLLFIAEWFAVVVLVLLFGALGFAEMARAGRAPKKTEGSSIADLPSARMTRWHVVAAILIVGNALMLSYGLVCTFATSGVCLGVLDGPALGLDYALTELSIALITLPALFGPMYAVRLHRQGVRAAEFIGLGVLLLPVSLLTITSWFGREADPESLLFFGAAGLVMFALGLALPGRRAKMLVLSTSGIAMLIALTDFVGPENPVWLLAAIAMGYTVFRAEWKHSEAASRAADCFHSRYWFRPHRMQVRN